MKGRGGLCVMMSTGVLMMQRWSAVCWDIRQCWQLMSSTGRAVVLCGSPTWPALGVRTASVNVRTLAGEKPLAATLRTLESPVAVSSVCFMPLLILFHRTHMYFFPKINGM